MERLSDAAIEIINMLHRERIDYNSEYLPLIDAVNRLSAYEGTGLTPEEIEKARYAMKSALGLACALQSYRDAEREGRLVVLPCKASGKLYVCGERQIIECDICEVYLDDKNGIEYLVSFDCACDCDGCPFSNWKHDFEGEYSCDGEYGQSIVLGSYFGKTVFLTREEAEKALKGGEAG